MNPGSDAVSLPCSAAWRHDSLTAVGTAPLARFWVALEQPGPWRHTAITESRLDQTLAWWLDDAITSVGGRLVLIRGPGERGESFVGRRQILISSTRYEDPVLLQGSVSDTAELESVLPGLIRWATLANTAPPRGFGPTDSVLLVCTNGRRDQCCATLGRPLSSELAAAAPGRIWETSHLSGHRFAPTLVVLPTMQMLARADTGLALAALTAADRGLLAWADSQHDRGRSVFETPRQVADSVLRHEIGEHRLAQIRVGSPDSAADAYPPESQAYSVPVCHRDGRSWQVEVHRVMHAESLPPSCGAALEPAASWTATIQQVAVD